MLIAIQQSDAKLDPGLGGESPQIYPVSARKKEEKLIKKMQARKLLQEEADKDWEHRNMYQWLRENLGIQYVQPSNRQQHRKYRKPEYMRFDDPLRKIPSVKQYIRMGDKALEEIFGMIDANPSCRKVEWDLKTRCDSTLCTGPFEV